MTFLMKIFFFNLAWQAEEATSAEHQPDVRIGDHSHACSVEGIKKVIVTHFYANIKNFKLKCFP